VSRYGALQKLSQLQARRIGHLCALESQQQPATGTDALARFVVLFGILLGQFRWHQAKHQNQSICQSSKTINTWQLIIKVANFGRIGVLKNLPVLLASSSISHFIAILNWRNVGLSKNKNE